MDWVNVLFWIHLVSLALGGAASFGIPVVGAQAAKAAPEARPVLFKVAKGLSTVGRVGIVLLLITGPLMLWLRFGWAAPNQTWFWIKMALVALLLVVVIYAGINAERASKGDMAAAKRGPMVGMAAMAVFVAIIFSAVFAFG